jgi:hypothetical protein
MNSLAPRLGIRSTTLATALAAMLLASPLSGATQCRSASGAGRVAVLELYTSEGCDSCPAADNWVSGLPARKFTDKRVIPLAFHVDYWNQLGWIDPYSQAIFSARQRAQSQRHGVNFVVTPQLLLNGRDFRRGILFDDFDNQISAINHSKPAADIRVETTTNIAMLSASLEVDIHDADQSRAGVFVALYENNLVTQVRAGENKGRTLKHDFVVREFVGPLATDSSGALRHALQFPLDPRWKSRDLHLAVFVQHRQSGDVLQALAATCQ